MKRHFLLILIFVLPFFEGHAQNEKTYEQQWKLVDSLINKMNQPKTAIKYVDKIYQQARTERNVDQSVKALVYKLSLSGSTKDDRPSHVVEMIDSVQLHPINPLENSLLWCLKAQLYSQYLQDNQWKIQNKKDTFATKESDWATWTTRDFEWHIYYSYQKVLSDSIDLQNAKVQQYPALVRGKDYKLRPTLYDLVLQIAIYHYGANIDRYSPKNGFQLSEQALGTLPSFLAYNASSSDTLSNDKIALELYQKVLRFHQKQDNIDALLDANNERIAWAYRNISSNIINKDSLYINTLRNTISQYPNNPISLQSAYMVASYYNGLSQKYVDNKKDTANRYKRITALSYIHQYLPNDTVKTEGWLNLTILKNEIETSRVLEAKMESVNIPNKPMLAWVNSYLVKKLYLKVVAVRPSDYKVRNLDSMLKVRPAIQEFTQDLPERGDYQAFSTEIKVDGLPIGSYWLVASEDKEFTQSHVGVPIKVSQLGYFSAKGDGFVVDRETGAPIADVRMKVRDDSYKNIDKKNSQLVSDKNGHFVFRSLKKDNDNWYYLSAVLYKGIDSLPITINQLNNLMSVSSEEKLDAEDIADNREDNVKARYVSDRNIYRPGQKIYFKTYFATKDDENLPFHIWKRNKEITVFLTDANNQTIDSLILKQDDYGTVNGSFTIPNGKLTGRYSLSDDWSNEDLYFQVEEYKRPTFFVETDSVKQTYRLGDSVAVGGTAIAYSGAKVSSAKVKVHVSRRTRFTYYWHRPSSYNYNTADILDTIVETDNQGKFRFLFKAVPDQTIDSTTLPIFQYQCTVDVTDANGETHNTEKQVAVGYQSVELHWNVGNDAKVESLDALKVSTKNTNGIAVPTSVHVSIQPVVNPGWLLHNKLWDQPDIQVIDSIAYKKYFPHDIYGKEDDKEYWAKSVAIYDKQIASDSSLKFNKTPTDGWYYLEATAVSPEGKPLKDFCYVQLVKDGNVVNDQYFQGIANNYVASVGDTVNQFVATAADQLQVVEMTDSKKGNQFRCLTMEKGIHKYTTIITNLEQYPLNHSFATYKDNRFYSENLRITTQPKTETLDVQIKTFRDKTEPGSKEKWSVRVSKNDTITKAQLLSTMYDASLDQIKGGDWYYGFPHVNIDRNTDDFNSNETTSDYSRELSIIFIPTTINPTLFSFSIRMPTLELLIKWVMLEEL